jgi:hypothetical protein
MTRSLLPAFVTTVAAASTALLAAGAGCGVYVTHFEEACDFGEPGCDDACPETAPEDDAPCHQRDQSCTYYSGCDETDAHCDGEEWHVSSSEFPCNPPPPEPECPIDLPQNGTYCEPSWSTGSYRCEGYLDPQCDFPIGATCTEAGLWEVDLVSCNPPPPDYCRDFADYASCSSDSFCRWLEPGCGDTPLEAAGCFAVDDCFPGSCEAGFECEERIHDPCWNLDCESCGAPVMVCIELLE